MPCLIVLVAVLSPRLALVLMAIFNDRLSAAFDGITIPLLGFFLLPWTTLTYALAWAPVGGVSAIGWVFVGFGFLLDLGAWGAGPFARGRARTR